MSTETNIAGTLGKSPAAVATSAATAFVACSDYPYALVRMADWKVARWALVAGLVTAIVGLRARVNRWLERRHHSRAIACARVVSR